MLMRSVIWGAVAAGLAAGWTSLTVSQAQGASPPGKRLFLRCAACHSVTAAGPKKLGPHLQGVVGRPAASVVGFAYSPAMKAAKVRWDEATLDQFLTRPTSLLPGTSMVFPGLANPEDRRALITWLKKPTS